MSSGENVKVSAYQFTSEIAESADTVTPAKSLGPDFSYRFAIQNVSCDGRSWEVSGAQSGCAVRSGGGAMPAPQSHLFEREMV
jgi:hypothetical protein